MAELLDDRMSELGLCLLISFSPCYVLLCKLFNWFLVPRVKMHLAIISKIASVIMDHASSSVFHFTGPYRAFPFFFNTFPKSAEN